MDEILRMTMQEWLAATALGLILGVGSFGLIELLCTQRT